MENYVTVYATQNRQNAIRNLSAEIDLLLAVGARNSYNSNRLRETGGLNGLPAYLIEDAEDIDQARFQERTSIGITAGASTPEILVHGVVERSRHFGVRRLREMDGEQEKMRFSLPKSPYL